MIIFFAAVMQFLEFSVQPYDFHDWIYFAVVTITVVGYGDIAPKTTLGRAADMCIIAFSIITIPMMTTKLFELMKLQSVYSRTTYFSVKKRSKHVVICGDHDSAPQPHFFDNIFHKNHNQFELHVVLVFPDVPTVQMILLLQESIHSSSITYLQGSGMNRSDLQRAKLDSADAVLIVTNKLAFNQDDQDMKCLMLRLSILKHLRDQHSKYHLQPRKFLICTQLIRPENKKNLSHECLLESSYNLEDVVLCLDEIKMGMLAQSLSYPGANTLLINLITPFDADEVQPQLNENPWLW